MNGNEIFNKIYKGTEDGIVCKVHDDLEDDSPKELGEFYMQVLKLKSLMNAGIINREVAEEVIWSLSKKFKTKYIYL